MSAVEDERAALEAARSASTTRLLLRCARLVSERAIGRVRARTGERRLRLAHTTLLLHVDLEGIRLVDLAARLGVSKQATARMVAELESMRVLERAPDPLDGRAKLIRFGRRRGRHALFDVLAVLAAVEADLAGQMPAADLRSLRRGLQALSRALEPRPRRGQSPSPS